MVTRYVPRTSNLAPPFVPGHRKVGGRKKGTPNRATRFLKEAVLLAAEAVGEDGKGRDGLLGYCKMLAKKEPRTFTTLLVKAIPMEITGDADRPIVVTLDDRALANLAAGEQEVLRAVLKIIAASGASVDVAPRARPAADPSRYAETLRPDSATEGRA